MAVQKNKSDGWANLLTGMGSSLYDRTTRTSYNTGQVLAEAELDEIYRGDGVGRRVVDVPAQEMTRQWFEVEGDTDGKILKGLEEIKARKEVTLAMKWARLYGGSVIVMGLNDAQSLDKPLRETNISEMPFLRVYGRFQVDPNWNNLIGDPEAEMYGTPEFYRINPLLGTPYDVHHTRLLIFDGEDVPDQVRRLNNGWGDSSIQCVYDDLRNCGIGFNAATNILVDFIQATLSIKGLQDMLSGGQEDLVKKRLNIMDLSRSVLNILLLDENELYDKKVSSVAGLSDMLDRLMIRVSASSGIPVTKLFGRSPAGENATGESDVRNWYDDLKSEQEDKIKPQLEKMVKYLCLSKQGPTGGIFKEDYKVKFRPLWQMDDQQTAQYRHTIATSDDIYVKNGVLLPEEVANARFGGDTYSAEMELDQVLRTKREKEKEEMKKNMFKEGAVPGVLPADGPDKASTTEAPEEE